MGGNNMHHLKSNKEDGIGLVSNLPLNIRSQYKKTFHYFQTTKTKCGIVLTILVLVTCIAFIFYSPLNTDAQIRVFEKALNNSVSEMMVHNTSIVLEKPQNISVPVMVQNTSIVLEKPQNISVPEMVQNMSIVLEKTQNISVPVMVQNSSIVLENTQNIKVSEKVRVNVTKKVERPLYFFGDSLFDTGQGHFVGLGNVADSYPYGKTYFKRPAGRYSDGLLIPDFLAQFADLPLPQPYGNPYFADYTRSVNFAGTSAGILVDGRNYSINLNWQTDYFVEMVGKMKNQYGKQKTKKLLSNAVLVFHIGSNDYTDVWIQNPKPIAPSFVEYFVNKMVGNVTNVVTRMYNEGARKFAFLTQGPMGCIPLNRRQGDGRCEEGLNDIVKLHNRKFDALVKTWPRLFPGLKYTVYDFYNALHNRILDGPKYGFKESKWACCGSGKFHAEFTCMEKGNFTLCDDIPSHLFFDPVHPTQHADLQFAQEIWAGPTTLIKPSNLKDLLNDA